jgi:hypothetical protein
VKTLKPNFGSMFQKNQLALGCRRLPGSSLFAGGNWDVASRQRAREFNCG